MASDNDLLIFGYACKVYHDDEKALHVENALIPWMGDETITIDRYDGRGHLNSLREFEPKKGFGSESPSDDDPEEKLAESERWLSLTDEEAREEILKRAAAPVETHFSEVGFNYEENKAETFDDKVGVENRPRDFEDPDEKPYKVPKGLTIPVTVPRPDTRREHIIIQKTASFIARQGAQLEVVIKAKQKDNPQFAFMDIEHRLNLYYRFLIQQIKTGSYRPSETEEISDSDSDSSDDYLHPSLFAKSSTKSSGPPDDLKNLFKSSTNKANCAYSQLISRIKPTVDEQQDSSQDGENALSTLKELVVVMPPPPDVQPIVDKMAEYVAKNGKDFEDSIRAKGDPKFEFVSPNHEFFEYYQYKLNEFRRSVAESAAAKVAPSAVSSPDVAQVKPKSPNALERIALDNSYHNSSIEVTPKIRRIEKKKLKINIKTQDKSLLASEKIPAGQSMIGPLLPSLYDDEDDVDVKEEVTTTEAPSNGRSCDEPESKSSQESDRTNASIESSAANLSESKSEWSETVVDVENAASRSTKTNDQPKQENDGGEAKCRSEENSNSADPLEDSLKKKQLERKQKLAAFLSTLKSKKKDDSTKSEKAAALEENRPPSSSSASTQPDLKSTIRNLKRAVVESDDERDVRRIDVPKKYSKDERYDSRRRSPSDPDRRHWRHKRRDRSRSQHSSDSDEDDRRHRRRDRKRRRSSSGSRGSSAEGRSRNYSARKHHKSKSSRSRRD